MGFITSLTLMLASQQAPTGMTSRKFTVGQVEREYLLYVPPNLPRARSYPLIMAFHGMGSTAEQLAAYSRLNTFADKRGYIVCYPNGLFRKWALPGLSGNSTEVTNDVAFADAICDQLAADFHVNPDWTFAVGFSNGAMFTLYLSQYLKHKLGAVAIVAGTLAGSQSDNFAPTRPVPTVLFNGTSDRLVPYAGIKVGKKVVLASVEDTLVQLVKANKCKPVVQEAIPNLIADDACTTIKRTYSALAPVIHYKTTGAGHTWPGSATSKILEARLGAVTRDFDASEVIFDFFDTYRK